MENTKIFCGSGKTRSGQYGDFQAVSICLTDIPKEHITTANNGKQYVSITVSKKREVDQYGKDLSVTVDTWKPDPSKAKPAQAHTPKQEYASDQSEGLPF
jgi:hypothetical protein